MKGKHTPGPWRFGAPRTNAVVSDTPPSAFQGGEDHYGGCLVAESIAPENLALIAAAPELLAVCERQVAWLEMLAERADKGAADRRFISLAEAHAADAKNYRATAKPIREAIAKATKRVR